MRRAANRSSCSLTINSNETATVKLGPPATGSGEVQVVSSVFYPDAEIQSITWVAELRNTTAQWIESAEVEFVTLDASGGVLATTSAFAGPIPPGDTRAIQGLADLLGNEASSALRILDVQFGEPVNLGVAEIVSSAWSVDPAAVADGFIPWTVEVRNTGSTSSVRSRSISAPMMPPGRSLPPALPSWGRSPPVRPRQQRALPIFTEPRQPPSFRWPTSGPR